MPGISITLTEPEITGGATAWVRVICSRVAYSVAGIDRVFTVWACSIRALSSRVRLSLSRVISGRSKSRRPLSALMLQPVTGASMSEHNKCRQVCIFMCW